MKAYAGGSGGAEGPVGPAGPEGPIGPQGPQGEPGTGGINTREILYGNPVTVPNTSASLLGMDNKFSGSDLFDFSDPTVPVCAASGVYSISAIVEALTAMTPGGYFQAYLALDNGVGGDNAAVSADGQVTTGDLTPSVTLSCTYYVPEGGTIGVQAINEDGVSDRSFRVGVVIIQRIS